MTCTTVGCLRLPHARGLCGACYRRQLRAGMFTTRPVRLQHPPDAKASAETRRYYAHVVTIERIRANPAVDECPRCALMKPVQKPLCECCQAERSGECLSLRRGAA